MALLPPEIYDEILGHLWDDAPALRAASTAARALTHPAQTRLFAHIVLHSPSLQTSRTAPRLRALLARAPHLARHVQFLEVAGRETPAFAFCAREDALMFCLPLMTRLRALRVGYRMDLRRECLLFSSSPRAPDAGGGAGVRFGSGGASAGVGAGAVTRVGGGGGDAGPCLARILADTLRLPTLECVEFAHLPIEFIAHCRSLRALALQDPDTRDAVIRDWLASGENTTNADANDDTNANANASSDPTATEHEYQNEATQGKQKDRPRPPLESLQLDCASAEVTDALRAAGYTLSALRTLSIRGLDYTDADCTAGVRSALADCAPSLRALELDEPQAYSFARILNPTRRPAPGSGSRSSGKPDPIPWGALRSLRALRINLAFPADTIADDDDNNNNNGNGGGGPSDIRALAGQHLLWLAHILSQLSSGSGGAYTPCALEEVVLQDYTDYWEYFTDDIYVAAWTRIVALLSDRAQFPHFRTLVVDSKRSVTQKIQHQILDQERWRELPFAVRLGPGQLVSKLGRSFLRTLFGSDWQASDI